MTHCVKEPSARLSHPVPRDNLAHQGQGHLPLRARARLLILVLSAIGMACCGGGGSPATTPPAVQLSVQVSPGSLTFGSQTVGTSSAAQAVTLTNTGEGAIAISAVSVAADFAQTNNCPASLGAGSNCSYQVVFTPTAAGSRTGTLSITTTASTTPQTVSLTGTGVSYSAQVSPASLTFANQGLGVVSPAQSTILTNTGTGAISVNGVSITGDFSQTNNCPASLASGANCTIQVAFTPVTTGVRTGTLTIATSSTTAVPPVGLTGTGVPWAEVAPQALTFLGQPLGTPSAAQTVTLTNIGTAAIDVTGIDISGDFTQSNNCPSSLVASSSCSIQVVFAPAAAGTRSGGLSIATSATSTAQTVSLTGTGNGPFAGVFTQRYDNGRSGQNTQETLLTPSNVTVNDFGKLFSLPVDGQVYAQPLYVENVAIPNQGVHNVLYVATEHDSVFAFDADGQSTTALWQESFINPAAGVTTVPAQDVGSADINPEIGITSTPVIDPAGGTLYVTAKTKEAQDPSCASNCVYNYFYRLHALDIATGAEKFGGPVAILATIPGDGYDNVNGAITFLPLRHLQRPGLLLLNGTLYIGFGSHGDVDPYHGWLLAYDTTTLQQAGVFNVTPNGEQGAIWQSGGGISADANGNIYLVTANGTFDANAGGTNYGDSVLKLQLQSGRFQVVDYFTPDNQLYLAQQDLDLGSSPALILSDQPGSFAHLMVTGGKDGRVWLLNRDNLGHIQSNDAGEVQVISGLGSGLFGGATYWNGNVYLQEVGSFLNQLPLQNGRAQSPIVASFQCQYPDAPPTVSASGSNNGIVWLVESDAFRSGGPAVLHAFDATNVGTELYNSGQAPSQRDQAGPAVKFVVPTVANGKVYVGTASEVDVYGLLP